MSIRVTSRIIRLPKVRLELALCISGYFVRQKVTRRNEAMHRFFDPVPFSSMFGIEDTKLALFGSGWNDSGLWDDVMLLAGRAWNASTDEDRLLSWHHLVMAVGNFKSS
jgi:hypothetical protein